VSYEVWLDERGRINELIEIFTFSQVPGSFAAKDWVRVTSTSPSSTFGTPVTVTVPAVGDVVSPSAAAGGK
jgi:hypothetical protein